MIRSALIKIVAVLFLVFTFCVSVSAYEAGELSGVIEKKIAVITGLLQSKNLDKELKDRKILQSVEDVFDYELMARLSLGKSQWNALDSAEKEAFTQLFIDRIKRSYLEKMYLYTDEEVEVKEALQVKPTRIHIPSNIIGKNGNTEILYKFYRTQSGGWLIYDVEIAGVSVVQTYRAQFAEFLDSSPFEKLLAKLKSPEPL